MKHKWKTHHIVGDPTDHQSYDVTAYCVECGVESDGENDGNDCPETEEIGMHVTSEQREQLLEKAKEWLKENASSRLIGKHDASRMVDFHLSLSEPTYKGVLSVIILTDTSPSSVADVYVFSNDVAAIDTWKELKSKHQTVWLVSAQIDRRPY